MAFSAIDQGTGLCDSPGGCCLLKSVGVGANASTVMNHCSAIVRPNLSSFPPLPSPAPPPMGAKNVLHIISDDLRPSLSPYEQAYMSTPALQVRDVTPIVKLLRIKSIYT